jgi:hypothetical protein
MRCTFTVVGTFCCVHKCAGERFGLAVAVPVTMNVLGCEIVVYTILEASVT